MSAASQHTYKALTFDCYGTLVDWRSGLLAAVRAALGETLAAGLDEARFLHHRQCEEACLEAGPFRAYRDVVAASVKTSLAQQGIDLSAAGAAAVAASVGTWPIFADTQEALARLGRGRRLVIVSNVDRLDLERTVERLGVPFHLLITAGELRSYKPAPLHLQTALLRLGLTAADLLHVAQSLYHDIQPAAQMGLDTAWINRLDEPLPESLAPTYQVPDLASLAALLDT